MGERDASLQQQALLQHTLDDERATLQMKEQENQVRMTRTRHVLVLQSDWWLVFRDVILF